MAVGGVVKKIVIKKKVELKTRNYLAMNAWMRNGAGQHIDQKQRAKVDACDPSEWADELQDYWSAQDEDDDE